MTLPIDRLHPCGVRVLVAGTHLRRETNPGRIVGSTVFLIDLAGELDFEDSDFYDSYHNTPQGAAKIGRYLYQKMAHLSF